MSVATVFRVIVTPITSHL